MRWITRSNRLKHLLYAVPFGFLLTVLFAAGLATGMELKDKLKGGRYDWLDWVATVLGGLIGQALQLLVIWGIIR